MLENILVLGLVSFTITFMLHDLVGPFEIFRRIREKVGIDANFYIVKPSRWADLFHCFWCLTTWVCLIISAVFVIFYGLSLILGIYLWLGAVAVSGIIYTGVERANG